MLLKSLIAVRAEIRIKYPPTNCKIISSSVVGKRGKNTRQMTGKETQLSFLVRISPEMGVAQKQGATPTSLRDVT
jgi:hypothetical protein